MRNLCQLFSSVAVMAEFHPKARALRFRRDASSGLLCSDVVLDSTPLLMQERLEADIALIASHLTEATLPDYYAFCVDVDRVFNQDQAAGPVARLEQVDWRRFNRLVDYACYWKASNPGEVAKLVTFVMAFPLFSMLVARRIVSRRNKTETEIFQHVVQQGQVFMMGVNRFHELFFDEINESYNEAKMLVATYRGTRSQSAEKIVNNMVNVMLAKQNGETH